MRSKLVNALTETPTRLYRGRTVDVELKDDHLDRLNSVRGTHVTSVCAGHEDSVGQGIGGSRWPHFVFEVFGAADKAEALAQSLRSDSTTVETYYWGGPHENWVTHSNGKPRLDVFSQEQIDQHPPKRFVVNVNSTGKLANDDWWEAVLKTLGV